MACLLRLPDSNQKGVISFTTPEHEYLIHNPDYLAALKKLSQKYWVGLHFNWHNFAYVSEYNYDFLMAGREDVKTKTGEWVPTLDLDACNFSPACMGPQARSGAVTEKHWDILYVARGVFFKGIENFFECIRSLYDLAIQEGRLFPRVLFLCPAPPGHSSETNTFIAQYESLFNATERKYFNFLVLNQNYPFFFDLETLSFFYRASRVFVHTANDERRCRVAAYAFCTGIPVVGLPCIGSILSEPVKSGLFFEAKDYSEFPALIHQALQKKVTDSERESVRRELSEVYTVETLKERLKEKFLLDASFKGGRWFTEGLDIRLGRHHGMGDNPNSVPTDLGSLMNALLNQPNIFQDHSDPERSVRTDTLNHIPKSYVYYRDLRRFFGRLKSRILK